MQTACIMPQIKHYCHSLCSVQKLIKLKVMIRASAAFTGQQGKGGYSFNYSLPLSPASLKVRH